MDGDADTFRRPEKRRRLHSIASESFRFQEEDIETDHNSQTDEQTGNEELSNYQKLLEENRHLYGRVESLEFTVLQLQDLIQMHVNKKESSATQASPSGSGNTYSKLPEGLPSFSGQVKDYISWITSFENLVLDVPYADKVKFEAFKKATRNIATLLPFHQLTGTKENLDLALSKLKSMYGSESKIGHVMIQELHNLHIVREFDTSALQRLSVAFSAAVQTAVRNNNLAAYESQIRDAVMCKLPAPIRLVIAGLPGTTKSLDQLQAVIETALESYEDMDRQSDLYAQWSRSKAGSKPPPNRSYNTQFKKIDAPARVCPFDGESHYLKDCKVKFEDRVRITAERKLCVHCLNTGHGSDACTRKRPCFTCKEEHHGYLCQQWSARRTNANHVRSDGICFKTTVVTINNHRVRLLIDQGSGRDFVSQRLVTRLGLPSCTGPLLNIHGFGNNNVTRSASYALLPLIASNTSKVNIKACVVPSLGNGDYPTPPPHVLDSLSRDLRERYSDSNELPVELIIGLTTSQCLLYAEKIVFKEQEYLFSVQDSKLGIFVFGGRLNLSEVHLKFNWDEKALVEEVESSTREPDDQFVSKFVRDQVTINNGRAQVRVPVTGPFKLTSNGHRCYNRIRQVFQKSKLNGRLKLTEDILNEWTALDIIEPAPEDGTKVRYMTYHIVSRPDSNTTKHRLVFDGSFVDESGQSLNNYLFKGETSWNLTQSILRFRSFEYPLLGDLSKAFLMVQVEESDRDLFRFWWPDDTKRIPYRFKRVPFGTSASPFLLFAVLKKIGLQVPIENFDRLFYVDDLVYSFIAEHLRNKVKQQCENSLAANGFKINWKEDEHEKVLGLRWNRVEDSLGLKPIQVEGPKTARQLASIIARIFDPIGIIEPAIAELRRIFSRVWKTGLGWEGKIPEHELPSIDSVLEFLADGQQFTIPRWLGFTDEFSQIFHVMCDANDKSIGAVIYAESTTSGILQFVFAKSRLHKRSIPEAELDALLLGSTIVDKLITNTRCQIRLWTDSKLNYYRFSNKSINDLAPKQARKVMQLNERLCKFSVSIGFLPGKENPADFLTKFNDRSRFWEKWTNVKLPTSKEVHVFCKVTTVQPDLMDCEAVLDDMNMCTGLNDLLTRHKIEVVIQAVQQLTWKTEIESIVANRPIPKSSILGPYYYKMENGILTTKLRTEQSTYRILLPVDSRLTELICDHIHVTNAHSGIDTVIALYKSQYYTHGITRKVGSIVSHCETCQRMRKPKIVPSFGPMASEQVTIPNHAFARIGVDFAGPITTTDGKKFVLVVTCLNSRGIYLKSLHNQDSEAVISALRIISSVYGAPEFVYSDNASVFQKSSVFLKRLYELLPGTCENLRWKFSFAGYPRSNGVTEVMVKATKRTLKGLTFGKRFTDLELDVFLAESAHIINNRPLFWNNDVLITPSHLIFGRSTRVIPSPTVPISGSLAETYSVIRKRVHGYWNSWKSNYLADLRYVQLKANAINLKIGDQVMYEPHTLSKRDDWPTARVSTLHESSDGQIRLVDLTDDNGVILTRRPVGKLVKLEGDFLGAEAVANQPFSTIPSASQTQAEVPVASRLRPKLKAKQF